MRNFQILALAALLGTSFATMPATAAATLKPAASSAKSLVGGTPVNQASPKPILGGTAAATAVADTSYKGPAAVALAGSDVDKVGQVILNAVAGRTLEQALAAGGSPGNPFDLEQDPILQAAGVYFVSDDNAGNPIAKSEISIFPDFATPGGKFKPTATTPGLIPFAFNRGGICFGGYVTGFPVADKVFAMDMHGVNCNAQTIENLINTQYHNVAPEIGDTPVTAANGKAQAADASTNAAANTATSSDQSADDSSDDNSVFDGTHASDRDLEMIVHGAYSGAYGQAVQNNNLFSSDQLQFTQLRSAMRSALEKEGYGDATVLTDPVADAAAAKACATDGKIDVRVAFNNKGNGISVVAVSDKRMSAYEYAPDKSGDLVVTHADDCLSPAAATTPAAPSGDRLSKPAR